MLIIALGLVLATMRQLNQPETAERLGQLFGSPETSSVPTDEHTFDLTTIEEMTTIRTDEKFPPTDSQSVVPANDHAADPFAQIKDNTYFRPGETEAWFRLFSRLQKADSRQIAAASSGELSYVQLLKQPDIYRGKLVSLRGTVRREELQAPAQNSLGIETYHRLWISPQGGGSSMFVVYCLKLPEKFPRGGELHVPVSLTGFFFKNWSYSSRSGLAIAPVVLAKGVEWQPPRTKSARRTINSTGLAAIVLAAGLFAVIFIWVVVRNTRRPNATLVPTTRVELPATGSDYETVDQKLQRLSDGEVAE